MDTTQLLLTIVLTVSTVFGVIIGVQLIIILKELRKTIKAINTVIDGFETVGSGLEHGFAEIVGFFHGFKNIVKVIDLITAKKNEKNKQPSTD
jgi:hypothetical protein